MFTKKKIWFIWYSKKSKYNVADRVKLEFYVYRVQGPLGEASPWDALFKVRDQEKN